MKENEATLLSQKLLKRFRARGWRLSIAESCTGGLLSSQITAIPGASEVFVGAVVCYSNDLKVRLLNVPKKMIRNWGAVSEPVALELARGAKKNLRARWGLSVTGIAGPKGGSLVKPVGTVCYGICGPNLEQTTTYRFKGTRQQIQWQSAVAGLRWLLEKTK